MTDDLTSAKMRLERLTKMGSVGTQSGPDPEFNDSDKSDSNSQQGGGSYPDGCMGTHHAAWHFNGGDIGGMPEYSAGYPQGGGGYGSSSSGLQYAELEGGGSCGGDHPHTTPMAGGMRRRNKRTRGRRTDPCDCDVCGLSLIHI